MAKVYITPPQDYSPPDDKGPGDEFDATVHFKIEDDGKLCPISIDGVPLDEKEPDDNAQEEGAEAQAPSLQDAVKAQREAAPHTMM